MYSSATDPSSAGPTPPPPPRPSTLRFAASLFGRFVVFFSVGYILVGLGSAGLILIKYPELLSRPVTTEPILAVAADDGSGVAVSDDDDDNALHDDDALDIVTPEEITRYLSRHPVIAELEADPRLHGVHPHHRLPAAFRQYNLTASTLIGPGLMAVPPFVWMDNRGEELVMILHAGPGLCGHPDIVHGGFVATIMDEGLARCCFKALPDNIGMTAYLNIDYRAPTPANAYLVLRAKTERVEGRKAWVRGQLSTLPSMPDRSGSVQAGKVLAEAEGLFISPRSAKVSAPGFLTFPPSSRLTLHPSKDVCLPRAALGIE